MAEAITLEGIDNIGNTIDLSENNISSGNSPVKGDTVVSDITATNRETSQHSLTAVSGKSKRGKNRSSHLAVLFAVATCFASALCVCVVFVVFSQKIANTYQDDNISNATKVKTNLRCINKTVVRTKAKGNLLEFWEMMRKPTEHANFQKVTCVRIPYSSNCSGMLPHLTTYFPNKYVDSLEEAEVYLKEIDSQLLDCDAHALYVICSTIYPPCITISPLVEPCKAVCEGVVDGCQELLSNLTFHPSISCEYSPVGVKDEVVCPSCSRAVELNIGEVFRFTSPNYPLDIASNTHCIWLFSSPSSSRLKINFMNVHLNKDSALQLSFNHNPYIPTVSMWYYVPSRIDISDDESVISIVNMASVIFKSGPDGGRGGFSAEVTALDREVTLSCQDFQSIEDEDICDGENDCEWAKDENLCRTDCGYTVMLTNEKITEVVSSTNSNSPTGCIYTFVGPTRTRLKLELLSLKGEISGCNLKIGTGSNPMITSSELSEIPELFTEINFPDNKAWIWFLQSSENSSFVVRMSSFSEGKVVPLAAYDSYVINTVNGADDITAWLQHGSLVFTCPPGYHFSMTSLINGTAMLESNTLAVGIGFKPLEFQVLLIDNWFFRTEINRDTLDLHTDALWLKLSGQGEYNISEVTISTVPTVNDTRRHILVDDVTQITFSSSDDRDGDVLGDTSTSVWIVTSIRHSILTVKLISFSCEISTFNFLTIGHGVDPTNSSSIVYRGFAVDFQRSLPYDVVINYPSFWIRHTSYSKNKTRFLLEIQGIQSTGNLRCPTAPEVSEDDICDDEFDCPDLSDEVGCVGADVACGVRPLHPGVRTKRVIGGSEPPPGSWPWQCLIFINDRKLCGCTLINDQWVISASHCIGSGPPGIPRSINAVDRMSVMFGSTALQNFSANHIVVPVALIFLHPEDTDAYNVYDYDFLLIKLARAIPFTNYIRPACISVSYDQFGSDDVCYISGFGIQEKPVTAMHEAPVSLFSNEKCKELQGTIIRVDESQICAGRREGEIGPCYGDSGGPLVCLGSDDTWYLVGLTSFGYGGCARRFRPAVFDRVFPYTSFINSIVNAGL